MKLRQTTMSPLDLLILLKICTYGDEPWFQTSMARELHISQSEISKSLVRSQYAKLLDSSGKRVMKMALMELLQYGVPYIFPQQPGAVVRGIPTAHSSAPLKDIIQSTEPYVWPSGKGTVRGQSIAPLYPSAVDAALEDPKLHEILALVDALRVGRVREKEIALNELKVRIIDGK